MTSYVKQVHLIVELTILQIAILQARLNLSPQDMFRQHPELYSQFDEDGVPTHDASGEKLSKSAVKKLRKDWEKQKKLFESSKSG